MLPNHAPLVVAEQIGTLETLHPGRIDLGLGRAPGTDPLTMRALRRGGRGEEFDVQVAELLSYFEPAKPGQAVKAIPGAGIDVPVWILGSSTVERAFRRGDRAPVCVRVALRARRPPRSARDLPRASSSRRSSSTSRT